MMARSVLVVEDDPILALDLSTILANAGYEVLGPVSTSLAALEVATIKKPAFALVDINLIDGRSAGIDVARRLKEHGTQCLLMSGAGHEARSNRDAALGVLEKPFSPTAVIMSVEAADAIAGGEAPSALPPGLELFRSRGGNAPTVH